MTWFLAAQPSNSQKQDDDDVDDGNITVIADAKFMERILCVKYYIYTLPHLVLKATSCFTPMLQTRKQAVRGYPLTRHMIKSRYPDSRAHLL